MLTRRRVIETILLLTLAAVAAVGAAPHGASAAINVPSGFVNSTYAADFGSRLTQMEFAPDGRLFVSEKSGSLRIVKNGRILSQPFLRLSVDTRSERGLLGVTFDPNFAANRYVYVFYTTRTPVNRVSRFRASASNPDVVEAGSERILLDKIPSVAGFHNGGGLHFGGDGKLYIGVGDSGTGSNAQSLSTLAGKLLRINADGSIPADNPFVGQTNRRPEIWAYGLRNPFTFAFRSGSSSAFINDVGKNEWEEINRGARGANYGWPTCEGPCSHSGLVDPIYAYSHESGPGKAIAGGAFYEESRFPAAYRDDYFFADYVGGYIKSYDPATGKVSGFATGLPTPADVRVGPDGALYYLSVESRLIGRISYGGSANPTPTPTPTPRPVGQLPTPTIDLPESGSTFQADREIAFSGSATDPEDGSLPPSALTWEVMFHHDTHTHPFVDATTGIREGAFTTADLGETSANTWYRIHLRATDSDGNTSEAIRDIRPRTTSVTVTTSPPGLEVDLDGIPTVSPHSFTGVERFLRQLGAPSTQSRDGAVYEFVSWSDGGGRQHTIRTPIDTTTYTATYRLVGTVDVLAADQFGRDVEDGWSSADTGGRWQTSGKGAHFAVGEGRGTLSLQSPGSTGAALLSGALARDVDILARVHMDERPVSGPFYVYLVARHNESNEYRPKIVFQPDGSVSAHAGVLIDGVEQPIGQPQKVAGTMLQAGTFYWMRAQVTGSSPTTIRIRLWAAGEHEPSSWQFVFNDSHGALQRSGQIGLRAYLSRRASNTNVEFEFDSFRAIPAT